MGSTITIRRGYDIKLKGEPEKVIAELNYPDIVACVPADYREVKPKLKISPGDTVQAGQCLFTDKLRPELRFTSPVSGEIAEIVLAEKRRIREIRILADKNNIHYVEFPKNDLATLSRQDLIHRLLESGCWNYIRQRPYSLIANPEAAPKALFISCFDSSPLSPDLEFIISQEKENFETGLKALVQLANGNVHLGLPQKGNGIPSYCPDHLIPEKNIHYFKGPHPSGNVGVHIHHIAPLQKDEIVWYVHPQDVIIIGRLFSEGRYRADRVVALTGSSLTKPQYIRVLTGQPIMNILADNLAEGDHRIIQGNVLHGAQTLQEDYLSFYTNHITVIPEGKEPAFLGWLLPGLKKLSLSRSYLSWLMPKRKYTLDTNKHGEERAFVMTGQYDKVLPMNIYPVFLLKAILAKDIEKMEALGIYEVAEEDFALCEFVCTSKIEVQKIIGEGLELMRAEE